MFWQKKAIRKVLFNFIYFYLLELFLWYIECYLLILYLLGRSTIEVTGPRQGGDVRGCPLTAILVLAIDI